MKMRTFDSRLCYRFARILLCATLFLESRIGFGADDSANNIPDYFLGTHSDVVPGKIGGAVPDSTISVLCENASGCKVSFSPNSNDKFDRVTPFLKLQYPQAALDYAKSHHIVAPASAMAWYASDLKPLLTSSAQVESCLDLGSSSGQGGLPDGYMLLCKLNRNPWDKPAILLMGALMANCGDLFCGYEIYPLFREALSNSNSGKSDDKK